jgi:hypothetical protein
MRDHVPAFIGLVGGALVHAIALQLRDFNNCCHLCTSRHLLCADCAWFQSTTVISISIPSARWAGVRGTVVVCPLLSFPSPVAVKHLGGLGTAHALTTMPPQ